MTKKLSALLIALGFLGLFWWWPKSHTTQKNEGFFQARKSGPTADRVKKRPLTKNVFEDLSDTKNEPRTRMRQLTDLKDYLDQGGNAEKLVGFIVSPNPYSSNRPIDPHSFQAHQHQKEASLRVHALKMLSENLTLEEFNRAVHSVVKDSQDQAIIRIAKQALAAKENGQNYFENLKQGIQNTPLPED
jgi:hypothetical protein